MSDNIKAAGWIEDLDRVVKETIFAAVQNCFDVYENQVSDRINADINSRQAELNNLLLQKQLQEIDREAETLRLKTAESEVLSQLRQLDLVRASL
ncbi:MAG TPA: hypothetical protein DCY88_14500 [Cyanobacteria bacterium UBA11372]|nr:hypothetical protein [Cyanobacteria bacterium UBA11372]HBE32726.1 hypothetical protein [Cyanobacteria bacterium UBA11368]HBE50456.1 hypothetical protein [Cyanobacteria bacterium UBA11369]